jgi:CRISPR-associated protein Cmr4
MAPITKFNQYNLFIIETLTNTHVGEGDVSFGVVDNVIQRDTVTKAPVFHSSSIKGALRDHCGNFELLTADESKELFGTEFNESPEVSDLEFKPGKAIFFDARLLAIPLRASKNVFYWCTSKRVLIEYVETMEQFITTDKDLPGFKKWVESLPDDNTKEFSVFNNKEEGVEIEIEDFNKKQFMPKPVEVDIAKIKIFIPIPIENLAVFQSNIFTDICKDGIPVIARNQLNSEGISKNLFYEEILPRRSLMYSIIGKTSALDSSVYDKFLKQITEKSPIVQFGANYSIGYGQSKIHKIA